MKKRKKPFYTNIWFYFIVSVIAVISIIYVLNFSKKEYETKGIYALDTYITVKISGDKKSSKELISIIEKDLDVYYNKFSPNIEGSDVYKLNHNREIFADDYMMEIVKLSVNAAEMTHGAFDPTIRPILELWGFNDENAKKHVPKKEEISSILPLINYKYIKIDEKEGKISLEKEGMKVDFGAIGKGYIVDKIIEKIKKTDPKATGFIDVGGEVIILGPKDGKEPWAIGIRDPFSTDPSKTIQTIYLKEGAIATSGNYERFFIEKGKRYHHIFDPKTGYPADNAVSATVIAPNGTLADIYSTSTFIYGTKYKKIEEITGQKIQAFIIDKDKKTLQTKGFINYTKK